MFCLSYNNITSLYGSPLLVGGGFYLSKTNIKTLKYAPVEIEGCLFCDDNKNLINIIHFPKHVGGDILLWGCNNLKSLRGCLKYLNGYIDLDSCYSLGSLKYGPHKVLGFYSCRECELKTLYGAPNYVGDYFNCSLNKLTSLKYSPSHIGGNFIFSYNNITTLNYFPDYVGGDVYCSNNPINSIWELFYDKKHIEYFNQLNIISDDGKKINIKKLNIFLKIINKTPVKSVNGYINI